MAVLTPAVTRWPVAAVGLGALVVWWPTLFGGTSPEQRQIASLEALVHLMGRLRARVPMDQALSAFAAELDDRRRIW